MRKFLMALTLISALFTVSLYAQAAPDGQAFQFIKDILARKPDYTYMIRVFQYTSTTVANNPDSYVLYSEDSVSLAKEAGLSPADKGKYINALKNRSPVRIKTLWARHKKFIFDNLSAEDYRNIYLNYRVDDYIKFKESGEYSEQMAKLKQACPQYSCKDLMNKAYDIGDASAILFWVRREKEKNQDVVFEILKEIQTHYSSDSGQ